VKSYLLINVVLIQYRTQSSQSLPCCTSSLGAKPIDKRLNTADMLDIPAKEIFIFSEGSIREDRCRKDSSRERPTEGSRTEGYRIRFLFPHVDVSSARNRNLRIRKQEKNMCCVCLILRSSCDARIKMSMIFYKNNRES
jgi:hypothetical protein